MYYLHNLFVNPCQFLRTGSCTYPLMESLHDASSNEKKKLDGLCTCLQNDFVMRVLLSEIDERKNTSQWKAANPQHFSLWWDKGRTGPNKKSIGVDSKSDLPVTFCSELCVYVQSRSDEWKRGSSEFTIVILELEFGCWSYLVRQQENLSSLMSDLLWWCYYISSSLWWW